MRFALNHITTPRLPVDEFFRLARSLDITEVEIRNDVPDVVGQVPPADVKAAAQAAGVEIISINALYPFNVWSDALAARAVALADYAKASGARALVMCPLNDGAPVAQADLVAALVAMAPILRERGLIGLVEPLGFPISSLRTKKEAVAAIDEAGGADVYRLVHDTFHHHLAGETEFFPERTGIVHISGVVDPDVDVADMLDPHRVLVDGADRLENVTQIRELVRRGLRRPLQLRAVRCGSAGDRRSRGGAPREHAPRDRADLRGGTANGQDARSHHDRPVVGRSLRRPGRRSAGGHGELLEVHRGLADQHRLRHGAAGAALGGDHRGRRRAHGAVHRRAAGARGRRHARA